MPIRENGFIFREPSDVSRQTVQRDVETLSPSYTRSYGFTMAKGRGAEVWDMDGNRFIDFAAGIAVTSTGHAHPQVVKAVQEQAERYLHIGGTDFFEPMAVQLAERLHEVVPIHGAANPDDKLTYFGNSGTEAIEAALKLARYRDAKRSHIIAFYGGFHGRTMGSLSLTASKYKQRQGYDYIPGGVSHVPFPARDECQNETGCCAQCWCDTVGFLEHFVFKKVAPSEVAAVIVEPIQGEGGYKVPRADFFPRLRELCDRHGILLVVDEVQSGIARTGEWFAIENFGVAPDIVASAKGIASGMPLSAITAHKDIMSQWVPGAHASTFGGNPVSCAAALATLDVIEDEGLLAHVRELGDHTLERMRAFAEVHPALGRVDGLGFMIGMDFVGPEGQPIPAFRDRVVEEAYLGGLLTLGCGASGVRFSPPLVLTRALLDEGLDVLERSIAAVEEEQWDMLATK